MIETDRFENLEITSAAQLRDWLTHHHMRGVSVWLVTFKAQHAHQYVSREAVLDELLCFGWIDGLRRKLDDDRTMQLISPRRHQVWAKSYKDRAARLMADGRMAKAGLAAIAESKRQGLWDARADVDALIVPPDLARTLAASAAAAENFVAFAPSYRRNVLRWLATAKTVVTRVKRIDIIVMHAAKGEKVAQF